MAATQQIGVKDGDVVLLVGTVKGAFILRSDRSRRRWAAGGPHFPGQAVYAMALDQRAGRRRLWASATSMHWGARLYSSDDFGKHWTDPETSALRFPEGSEVSLKQIWQIRPGRADEPDTLYCGVEPAALFASQDGGQTWALVQGLFDHPHRPRWQPGGGGLCLHTVLPDPANPRRLFVAISSGGAYRTDDGGATWHPRNVGVRAEFLPEKYPEFGQCVHKIAQPPARPERLYLQNHWGLYRSDDGGDSWQDIAHGVPSDFGFPMVVHPHAPDTAYVLPLESDQFRCVPEGRLRVYRTTDAGASWKPLTRGLPQRNAWECVLRDAMEADGLDPAGVYFGTRSGQLYGSRDGGTSWDLILGGLPPIVCVRAALVGEPRVGRGSRGAGERGRRGPARAFRRAVARPKPRRVRRAR